MPYNTKQSLPEAVKKLPGHAQEIWQSAYNSAYKQYNKDEAKANAVAWSAVKRQYEKKNDNWVKKQTSEIINPIDIKELTFAEGKNTTEIQVLPTGFWKHPVYGKIKIDEKDLDKFEKNFNSSVRKDLPITEGHSVGEEEKPAIGWFKQLKNKGRDGLWAVVEWTKQGMDLISQKSYKYFSPEFYTDYEDPETREKFKNVLVGGALTNKPYFKGLQAVVLSELILAKEMDLKDILQKNPTELTDEEVATLKEKQEELTDEQKETFKEALAEDEGTEEGTENTEETKKTEETEETKTEEGNEEKKEASEKLVVSKNALKFLETQAREGVKAMEKWKESEAKGAAEEMTFSETNSKGKFLPKSRDKVVNFMLSLSEKQQKAFKEIVAELPQANLFSEMGEGSGVEMKASDQVKKLVQEKLSNDSNIQYRQALEQVFAENPDLEKEYSGE